MTAIYSQLSDDWLSVRPVVSAFAPRTHHFREVTTQWGLCTLLSNTKGRPIYNRQIHPPLYPEQDTAHRDLHIVLALLSEWRLAEIAANPSNVSRISTSSARKFSSCIPSTSVPAAVRQSRDTAALGRSLTSYSLGLICTYPCLHMHVI
jgi:hypothetical protein